MTKTLFVAFSHQLTEDQVRGAKEELGCDKIVTLREVAPAFQEALSQWSPYEEYAASKAAARDLVRHAIKHGATHLYFAGEPSILLAVHDALRGELYEHDWHLYAYGFHEGIKSGIELVQSTTARESIEVTQADGTVTKTSVFKHVKWRVIS